MGATRLTRRRRLHRPPYRMGLARFDVTPKDATSAITFPAAPLAFQVMLALDADPMADPDDWVWTDFTSFVLYTHRIVVTRGRLDEQSLTAPMSCQLVFRNYVFDPATGAIGDFGILTPDNPNSVYFERIGLNTPLRVDVDPGGGWRRRFTGEISAWLPRRSSTVRNIAVTASGVLRRIGQGREPLSSTYFQAALNGSRAVGSGFEAVHPANYWPCEDESGATVLASATGGSAAHIAGVTPAADSSIVGSRPLPSIVAGGSFTAFMEPVTTNGDWEVSSVWIFPGTPAADTVIYNLYLLGTTARTWRFSIVAGAPDTIRFQVFTEFGVSLLNQTYALSSEADLYDTPLIIRMQTIPSGSNIQASFDITNINGTLVAAGIETVNSVTTGYPDVFYIAADANLAGAVFGHVASYTVVAALVGNFGSLGGDDDQVMRDRFDFLTTEAGIAALLPTLTTETMGPRGIVTLNDALRDCESADEGILIETKEGRLTVIAHRAMENLPVALALDNAAWELSAIEPVPTDDQRVRNDVTVSRDGGASARQVDDSGPRGVARVGRYTESVTLNLFDDDQPLQHAGYRLALGTAAEPRLSRFTFNLARPECAHLIEAWVDDTDVGSRVTIANPPDDMSPDILDQLLEGYTEEMDQKQWEVTCTSSPYSPHRILQATENMHSAGEFLGRTVPTTCVLAEALDTTETGVDVTTSTALLSTNPDDYDPPVLVRFKGETMLISGVSGSSNPQTMTVTRSVNGVVKTHAIGESADFPESGLLGL